MGERVDVVEVRKSNRYPNVSSRQTGGFGEEHGRLCSSIALPALGKSTARAFAKQCC